MSGHERQREELLAAAAAGELRADDPRLRALLAEQPRLGAELHDLEELAGDLEASGKLAREILAAAARRTDAPGAERIAGTLRAEIARTAGTTRAPAPVAARARRRPWPWVAAAAGIGAVLWLALRSGGAGDGVPPVRDDIELGGAAVDGLEPAGAVTELGEFRWRSTAPRDGFFELQVDDARRPFAGEEQLLERVSGLLEPRWTPDAERTGRWPARIRWRVRALDASRAEIGRSDWVEVERVSR